MEILSNSFNNFFQKFVNNLSMSLIIWKVSVTLRQNLLEFILFIQIKFAETLLLYAFQI